MGFTTGFLGGVTLTTATLYFTLSLHQRNRAHQSAHLRQQAAFLRNIVEPTPPGPLPLREREERVSVVETAKDKWNAEVESLVRRAQKTDWQAVVHRAEEGIMGVLGKVGKPDSSKN